MEVGLADEHGARLTQMRDRGRIAIRGGAAVKDLRRRCGGRPADVHQVFHRDRHAVQRTAIVAGLQLGVQFVRLPPRRVRHDENERVQSRVVGLDAPQAFIGDPRRRNLARAQPATEFLDRHHD